MKKSIFIIPFFNEENRIDILEYQIAFKVNKFVDFLLVDDGSEDCTNEILRDFENNFENVSTLLLKENVGKAEAIRQGVLLVSEKNYEYLGYLDADLATPISEMIRMLDFSKENEKLVFIMGCRIKLIGNNVSRSMTRHYFGRVFATIISQFILKTPIYDTQCGAKIMKSKLAKTLFEKPFFTKWLFDVELLLRFKVIDSNYIYKTSEFPLNSWVEKGNSKIKFTDLLLVPYQILKLYISYVK
jgi:dolichyl-phosphate beta-glucosyltransferase